MERESDALCGGVFAAAQIDGTHLAISGNQSRENNSFSHDRARDGTRCSDFLRWHVVQCAMFQSVPAQDGAGDRSSPRLRRSVSCFNPRPFKTERAAFVGLIRSQSPVMFQSSPARD